ncbi:MAG: phosphotransferase [Halieaceae bacterium]|jgi:aminoglycoside phosphotransferase (APT) family kinase protein|nr:Aminoglycoside phosphotransferase [marine gamma proteobacterium HTCC2080]MBT6333638.1 phosphotransferase [Halieaceae bacterium]MBT7339829.1 phosphotransferase [Halieaceae bacterium]
MKKNVCDFSGPLSAEKFAGGQSNPTFKLSAGDRKFVLRRKPPGQLLASAHAVDREFRVIAALQDTDVPVPGAVALCKEDEIIGSMFYLMEYLEGRVFWDPVLPELNNDERSAVYDDMNRVLAAMHSINVADVGLGDYGRPGNYFERQVGRWTKQYRASETQTVPAMEELMAWLPENMPAEDDRVALVHGDYRLDNVMFHPTEPKIIAVLDWELSTLGNPIADLAYQVMAWQLPRDAGITGLAGIERKPLAIPEDNSYVTSYCERTGRDEIKHWNFYLAFCFFRLAAIVQGVKKRALDGTASSAEAESRGNLVQPLAELGMSYMKD